MINDDDLIQSFRFKKLYNECVKSYGMKLINPYFIPPLQIKELTTYADIFSKSVSTNKEYYKMLAQDIMYGLIFLFPDDYKISYLTSSILTNVGNYEGRKQINATFEFVNPLDNILDETTKEFLLVPTETEKYYFPPQKLIYDKMNSQCLSYSGKTSLGKSFIMYSYMKDKIVNNYKYNYVIVVPTKALINQNHYELINKLNDLLVNKNYRVINSVNSILLHDDRNYIFIFTPERLLNLLCTYPDIKIDYLFIDEAHKISQNDSRSIFYYKVIQLIKEYNPTCRIIFASPNVPNPDVYTLLDTTNHTDRQSITTTYSPVTQHKFILNFNTGKIKIYNQISKHFIPISHDFLVHKNLYNILDLNLNNINIVYCGSVSKAVELAIGYAKDMNYIDDVELEDFSSTIKSYIHEDFILADIIKKGIAFHVGFLPSKIRVQLESLYKKGKIKVLFCTSTLIEGVNLPADNIFITTYKNGNHTFSTIDFHNLIGRVGRIKYNYHGNVFFTILNDSEENEYDYINMINSSIPNSNLLSDYRELQDSIEPIIQSFETGRFELVEFISSSIYSLIRKVSKHIFKNIIDNKKDKITEDLLIDIDDKRIKNIQKKYSDIHILVDDNLDTSIDQNIALTKAINDGLSYPPTSVINTSYGYNEILTFLNKLAIIYKWDIYERDTLGFKSNGEFTKLRYYAGILHDWISGKSLGIINDKAIMNVKVRNKLYFKGRYYNYDYNNNNNLKIYQNNIIISNTLKTINDIILYKLVKYFLIFSDNYKIIHNIKVFDNDWYDYLQYGTTNEASIFLQKCGFTREAAEIIKNHGDKYIKKKYSSFKINNSIENISNQMILNEFLIIRDNINDFIEDF